MRAIGFLNRKYKIKLAINFILIIIVGLLQIIYPLYIAKFINEMYHLSSILMSLLSIIGLLIFGKLLFGILSTLYSGKLYWDILSHLRYSLISRVLDVDYAQIQKCNIGSLTQTIENDAEQFVQFIVLFVGILLKDIFFILGIIVISLRVHLGLGLLILLISCIMFYAFNRINVKSSSAWEETKNANQAFFTTFAEVLSTMDEFLFIHQENYLRSYLSRAMSRLFSADFISSYVSYRLWIVSIFSFGFIKAFILLIGSITFSTESITPGTIYLFIYYIDMLNDPMEELRIQLEDIPAVNESIKRIKLILDMKNKLTYGDEILKGSIEEIEIQDMSFSYDEEYIFRDFNRKFDKGKVYGLIGASGSGKSTLINLITRLYDAKQGNIFINKVPVQKFEKGTINKEIKYIGQNELFQNKNKTIREFIATGNDIDEREFQEIVASYLAGVKSIDQTISKLGLSPGEIRTLIMIQAIYSNESVLLLDEIFSGVDTKKVESLLKKIKEQNKLIIIITHEKEIMNLCDEIIDLKEVDLDDFTRYQN